MSGGGWSCPHELGGRCAKVDDRPCAPGMKGCELYGRYAFFDERKNERLRQKQARSQAPEAGAEANTTVQTSPRAAVCPAANAKPDHG